MKRIFIISVAVIFSLFLANQSIGQAVPNGGMETWTTTGNYANPQGWDSPNQETTSIPLVGAAVVTKSGGAHSGSWCAKMENKSLLVTTVPGLITLGQLNINITAGTFNLTGGVPIAGRPSALKGFYKFAPQGGDTAAFAVLFTHFVPGVGRDTVGVGFFMDGTTVSSWTAFSAPVMWLSAANPDSMDVVIIAASSMTCTAGTTLYVDDLTLDYSTGISDPLMEDKPQVYFNAASQCVVMNLDFGQAENVMVRLYNINGQQLRSAELGIVSSLKDSFSVQGLKPGMYFVEVEAGTTRTVEKIVIQ